MNELTTTAGNAVSTQVNDDPWAQALASEGGSTGKFLKFDGNTGDFLFGPENDQKELAHGTRAVIDMSSYKRGFICWNDGKVIEEIMDTVMTNPNGPNKSLLVDHGPYEGKRDGWKDQRAFNLIAGEDDSLFNFKVSSGGGRRGCKNFLEAFVKEYRKHPGKFPVVELGSVKFDSKDADGKPAGKKHAPTFNIVGWFSQEEYAEMATAAAEAPDEDADGDENDEANYVQAQEEPETVATPPVEEVKPLVAEKAAEAAPAAAAETGRRAKRF